MFVATPPPGNALPPEAPVQNDGFFPDIEPALVRAAARVPQSITPARLRAAIIAAIITVELDLHSLAADAIANGQFSLAEIPSAQIDGKSVQVLRYERAIALYAKAELIERHRDFDTTASGQQQADDLALSVADLRRDAQHAVRDMAGRGRTIVDLV